MDYSFELSKAVTHFWDTRLKQNHKQGISTGIKDTGNRSAVTGGAQLDGFINLLGSILIEAGISDHQIFTRKVVLPGYFRPTKAWDLVIVVNNELIATIEFKSHIGPSFGNNFNNRVEEAIGSSVDILTAYREGAFYPSQKPWLGWLMLLEDTPKSHKQIRVSEPHFNIFREFMNASYAKRYEIFCERLIRERYYDGACLLLSDRNKGLNGSYSEPHPELCFKKFATLLSAHVIAFAKLNE